MHDKERLPVGMHTLIDILGEEAAEKLFRRFGGESIYIPKTDKLDAARRREAIRKEWNGHNTGSLARKHGLTRRAVQMIVAGRRLAPIPGQMSMLEEPEKPEEP